MEQIHAESAPGQFEVVTAHHPVALAADNLLRTREAIHAMALKHGTFGSFTSLFCASTPTPNLLHEEFPSHGPHPYSSLPWVASDVSVQDYEHVSFRS